LDQFARAKPDATRAALCQKAFSVHSPAEISQSANDAS
jgi:hypothetical protein